MKERGLLYKAPMVRAQLEGRKSQTRRLITHHNSIVNGQPFKKALWPDLDFASPRVFVDPGPSPAGNLGPYLHVPFGVRNERGEVCDEAVYRVYPRMAVGDREWVKECWYDDNALRSQEPRPTAPDHYIEYRADHDCNNWEQECPCNDGSGRSSWRSSLLMPRWASRITNVITELRAERVQSISEEDAIAEGVEPSGGFMATSGCWTNYGNDGPVFDTARESFRSLWISINGQASWDANPWCWVRTFKRIEATAEPEMQFMPLIEGLDMMDGSR